MGSHKNKDPITLSNYRAQFIDEKVSRYILIKMRFQAEFYKTKVSMNLASDEEKKTLKGLLSKLDEEELNLAKLREDLNNLGKYLIN